MKQRNMINSIGNASKQARRYMVSTALTATGVLALASPALADNWGDLQGTGFTTDTTIPDTTNINQNVHVAHASGDLDITENHTVNIFQPTYDSIFAVVDTEGDPTFIRGRLNANGTVIITDKNGVFFTDTSVVNVGSIVATTGDINADDIKDKKFNVLNNGGDGSIVLDGTISVSNAGIAAFVSPIVKNNGIINAKLGKVALAAGEKVTVDLYGDDLVSIAVDEKLSSALVENTGTINAEGGSVTMTAEAAAAAVDDVINMKGVVDVSSVSVKGGKIVLGGGSAGKVKVSGKLDANGTIGGDIKVLGHNVEVTNTSILSADALTDGNGGDVRVIGQNAASVRGMLSARGGSNSGNGGFVEVSGLNYLDFAIGNVNTMATNGLAGTLLIDPLDIQIIGGNGDGHDNGGAAGPGTTGGWQNTGDGGAYTTPTSDGASPYTVYESEIEGQSTTTNIIIQARRNITTSAGTTTDGVVTLAANRDLTIETQNNSGNNGSVDLTNLGFQVQGTGSMAIKAATGTVGTGDVRVGKLLAGNGNIVVSTDNGQIYLEKGAINVSGTGFVGFIASDRIFIDNDITTNGGNVTMEANRFTIDDTDAGSDNLDQIKTNGGGVRITANEVTLGETGGAPGAGEVLVDAGANGTILFERNTAGTIGIGGATGDTMLSDAELASLRARELFIGSSVEGNNKVTAIYATSVDTTANITGKVTLSAYLNQDNGVSPSLFGMPALDNNNVTFSGVNKFNALTVNANDHILTYTNTQIETLLGSIIFNADANAQSIGGMFLSANTTIDTNGNNFTFNGHQAMLGVGAKIDVEGGNILLNNDDVFHAFTADSLLTSGTGTITLNQWDKSFTDNGLSGFSAIGSVNNAVQAISNTGNGLNTVKVGAGTYEENVQIDQKNLLLWSYGGRDTTTINGISNVGSLGAVVVAGGINNVQLGDIDHGFTVNGIDNGVPGVENAAVYLQGAHDKVTIKGNKIVAIGDEALVTEYGSANSNMVIDNNIFTGTTYIGAAGTGDQFVDPNVARQLVALNNGLSDLTFTNNQILGTSGEQHLVAIESDGATITGNNFDGTTTAALLRLRGSDITVSDNDFDGNNSAATGIRASDVAGLTIGGIDDTFKNTISNIAAGWGSSGINILNGSAIKVAFNDLTNIGGQGIYAEGPYAGPTTQLDIEDNDLTNVEHNAIYIKKWNGADVERNVIDGTTYGHGIQLELTQFADVIGNMITNVGASGVQLWYGNSDTKVNKNLIHTTKSDAIAVNENNGLEVSGNVIGYTTMAHTTEGPENNILGDGVYVKNTDGTSTKRVVINKNYITQTHSTADNKGSGINVIDSDYVTIGGSSSSQANYVSNARWDGIRTATDTGTANRNIIRYNTVTDTARVGVYSAHATNLEIKNNTVNGATSAIGIPYGAIASDWGSNITISNNKVTNSTHGILMYDVTGSDNNVTGNKVDFVSHNGIDITNVSGLDVSGNFIGVNGGGVLGHGIYVDPSNVAQLHDNIITGAGGNGIWSLNNDDANIYRNVITNSGLNGILVEGGVRATIGGSNIFLANVINGTGKDGIAVIGSNNATVSYNLIGLLGGDDNIHGDGIYLKNSNDFKITRNSITNTYSVLGDVGDKASGIQVVDSSGNTASTGLIQWNTIWDTDWDGIRVQGGHDVNVKNNAITGVTRTGVYAGFADDILVEDNVINGTGFHGVRTEKVTGLKVLDNLIGLLGGSNNIEGMGVKVTSGDNVEIDGNYIRNTILDGIFVETVGHEGDDDYAVRITDNNLRDIGDHGIYVTNLRTDYTNSTTAGKGRALVEDNVILRTGLDGVHINNSRVDAYGNTINSTGYGADRGDGIKLVDSHKSNINGNFIGLLAGDENIDGDGIYLLNSNRSKITWNQITNTNANDPKGSGIHLNDSSRALIARNTIWDTEWDGIRVQGGDKITIKKNDIDDVGRSGIYVGQATDVKIDRNHIDTTGFNGIRTEGVVTQTISNNKIGLNGGDNNISTYGIRVINGANATIVDNKVTNAVEDGIQVDNVASTPGQYYAVTISGNKVWDIGGHGIFVTGLDSDDFGLGRGNVLVSKNKVKDVGEDAIHVEYSGRTEVLGNTIRRTGDDGIEVMNTTTADIRDNNIFNVGLGYTGYYGGDAIHVRNVGGDYIYDEVTEGEEEGEGETEFRLLSIVENPLYSVRISGNNINGYDVLTESEEDGDTTVFDPTNKYSADDGIQVLWSGNTLISGNDIANSGTEDGARIFGGDGINVVTGIGFIRDLTNSESEGSYYEIAPVQVDIFGNTVLNSRDDGIEVVGATDVRVDGNTVTDAGDKGITVIGFGIEALDGDIEVSEEEIPDEEIYSARMSLFIEKYSPTYVWPTFSTVISNNVVTDTTSGIQVDGFDYSTINNNTVTDSSEIGILLSGFRNGEVDVFANTVSLFDTGMKFESGNINLTHASNNISNGRVGMLFAPYQFGDSFPSSLKALFSPAIVTTAIYDWLFPDGAPIPTSGYAKLTLVEDDAVGTSTPYVPGVVPTDFAGTLGAQIFSNISQYYVELTNQAFWDFANEVPFWLDGRNSTYDTIQPFVSLSQEDLDILNEKFMHYPNPTGPGNMGIFFFGVPPTLAGLGPDIDESQFIRDFADFNGDTTGLNVRILGLPRTGGTPPTNNFNDINTFAGGETTPGDLNEIETAAGGDNNGQPQQPNEIEPASGNTDAGCWGDAMNVAGNGQAVNVVYTGDMADSLSSAAECGAGTGSL